MTIVPDCLHILQNSQGLTIQEAKTQQAEAWEAFISEEITSSVPGELQAESEPALEERASQGQHNQLTNLKNCYFSDITELESISISFTAFL